MHNPESVLRNETNKILWDFKIRNDQLISANRSDLVIANKNKRTCNIVNFAVSAVFIVKLKEIEGKDKYRDFVREL